MKGKTLIALVMAILMVASIVSASAFANIGTLIYNRIAPQDKAQVGIQTITNTGQNNPSSCTTQSDCPNGNCACKCAAKPAAGGSGVLAALTGKVTIPLSNLKLTPSTASSGTLIATQGKAARVSCSAASECTSKICGMATTSAGKVCKATCSLASDCETGKTCSAGRCITPASPRTAGQSCSANLPCATGLTCTSGKCTRPATAGSGSADSSAGALGSADTSVSSCQSTCLARCRAACTPSAPTTCTGNADCTSGYCRIVSSSAMPSITGTCVPCTLNNNCDTEKICSSGNCVNAPSNVLQPLGGRCTTNANCERSYCNPNRVCATCTLNTQCDTGKVCIIQRVNEGACVPLQGTGGYCNENADCRSNNCAKMVTTGSVRIGTCAAAVLSGSNTLSSKLRLPLTGRVTIPLSNLRIPANTAPSGTLITTQGKGVNVACTAASECTSKICGRATTSASKVCKATCSLASDCETGKRCSAGRCITPASPRTEGQSCSANLPCATGLACTNGVCEVPAAAGDSADSNANALSNADTSVGSCQAACTETCRLECTPSAGTKAIGEVCSSPTGCRTECETGYGECSCEGAAIAKKPEGESCNDNEECEAGLECTSNRLFGNKCTKVEAGSKEIGDECSADNDCKSEYCQLRNTGRVMAASGPNAVCAERLATNLEIGEQCYIHTQCKSTYCERPPITESGVTEPGVCTQLAPLTPEVQRQVRTNLDALEPKLERLEQQVVADRLVASREALIALSARLDCYVTINDIELKAECFKIRFETVTNLLESRGQITADKAREWKSKVGGQGQAVAQERRAEVKASPPPAKTFTQRVKDVFRITGSFWRVTGGFVVDETEVQVGTAGEELRVIEAIPTDYLNDLNTQYSQLAALETDICSKYPTTLTSASVLKSCTTNLQCGASGAVKCVSGKCRVDKAEVCTVGEFSSAAPSSTDTPPSPEGGMGDVEVILPPATCDSPIGFEIVSFCRGEESSGIAFVNISLRNTADIDINGFGLSLYKTDNSIINLPASTLPLLTARTEYLKNIRLGRFGSNFRGSSRVNPQIGTEQCNDKKQFFGIEGTLLPLCKGQPCTGSGACASGTCSAGVCQ